MNIVKTMLVLSFIFLFFTISPVRAFEITSDPTFIVINFSDSFHNLNWYASEDDWQKNIKPQAKQRLENIKSILSYNQNNSPYVLAWSTLMEYTNYPMDTPTDLSPYIIRIKRMMELAHEENFPIFIPLNGFQWWDELPELWNWWDYNGNQTPGCNNNEFNMIDGYKKDIPVYRCKFEKLRDPAYRKRFIKGFNPDNKWNVDWSDWQTPMGLSLRNWGGGDILVAPPPDIATQNKAPLSFYHLQMERYTAIVDTISHILDQWNKEGKQYLFAGMSIGTEVSLYGSINPQKNEIKTYGYRATQDTFCPSIDLLCGQNANWSEQELRQKRETILFNYFNNLSKIAHNHGIPKQRVYSHVSSEIGSDHVDFVDGFKASINLYSRPGQSAYQIANNPFNFSPLVTSLKENGYLGWAAPEFAPIVRDEQNWHDALYNTFHSIDPPKVIDIYNETDILNTPAIPQLKNLLNEPNTMTGCNVSEVIPLTLDKTVDPLKLEWKLVNVEDKGEKMDLIIWDPNQTPSQTSESKHVYTINKDSRSFSIPKNIPSGYFYWAVKRIGCNNAKWTLSNLHYFMIQSSSKRTLKEQVIRWFMNLFNRNIY